MRKVKLIKLIFSILLFIILMVLILNIVNRLLPLKIRLNLATFLFQRNAKIHKGVIAIVKKDEQDGLLLSKGMNQEDVYYSASISKLFTHSLIFQLVDDGKIAIEQSFREILKEEKYSQLLIVEGKDYTEQITIKHLLDQTSGLDDYETDPLADGSIIMDRLKKEDFSLTIDQSLELTRQLKNSRIPGIKAHYSNMNALLLGSIAEKISGKSLEKLFQENIIEPLKLESCQLASENAKVTDVYINQSSINPVKYVLSAPAAGGIILNNEDLMTFIKAFHQGNLFDLAHISRPEFRYLQFFPIQYGSGMMSTKMNFWISPILSGPRIIGHSGSTGSFAFYCPDKDVYITGTINQTEKTPFQYIYLFLNGIE